MSKLTKSKFTYAKCPYCKNEYREGLFDGSCDLLHLAKYGYLTETSVQCKNCKKHFKIKIHISYYGSKIKGENKNDK